MSWEKLFDTLAAREKQEQDFAEITEGKYNAFVYEVKFNETKTPPQIGVQWRIVTEGPFQNRHVFSNYSLSEKGIPFLKADLSMMDVDVAAKTLGTDIQGLVGREAKVYIKPRQVDDKTFYSVFINEHVTKDAAQKVKAQARPATKATTKPKFDADEEINF